MTGLRRRSNHTYCLLLSDDLKGCAQRIEFEAPDALRAMSLARDSLREREIELFEDGEPLGKLVCDPNGILKVISAGSMRERLVTRDDTPLLTGMSDNNPSCSPRCSDGRRPSRKFGHCS